jgi:hypothetical protein
LIAWKRGRRSSGKEKGRWPLVWNSGAASRMNERILMRERSAPRAVRSWSWVVVEFVLVETMTTPPWIVGVPSGIGEPEETLAAIWRARRLLPVP